MGGGNGVGGIRSQKVQQIRINPMPPESAPPKVGRLGAHSVKVASLSGTGKANLEQLLEKSDPSRQSIGNDGKASLNLRKVQVSSVRNVERKLSGDEVQAAVEKEVQSHVKQLTSGLLARNSNPLDPAALSIALAAIRQEADKIFAQRSLVGRKSLFDQKPLAGLLKSIDKAQEKLVQARANLTGVNFKKLGAAKISERLQAFAAAQSDLGAAVTDFTNCLRGKVGGSSGLNEKLQESLGALDDCVEAAAHDTAKVEELARTLGVMKKWGPLPKDLSTRINDLINTKSPVTLEDLKAAQSKIDDFITTAKHLFGVIASLDNASAEESLADKDHPVPTAAERLDALAVAYQETQAKLDAFNEQPGIDGMALEKFKNNFAEIGAHVTTLRKGLAEQYVQDAFQGLEAILLNGQNNLTTIRSLSVLPAAKKLAEKLGSYAIELRLFRKSNKPLVTALKDNASDICTKLTNLGNELSRPSEANKQLFLLSGVQIFESRVKRMLSDFTRDSITSPASAINSQLLGDVIRGELDLLNYLELKQSDLPVEMLRTELVPKQVENGSPRDRGSFNTVEFVPATNTRQGTSVTYVIKPHEKSAEIAAHGSVAKFFSDASHARNVAKLNFASKLSAQLIGCGSQITSNGVVRHRNQFMLIQEKATGSMAGEAAYQRDTALVVHDARRSSDRSQSIRGGLKSLPPATRARATISLQIEFAKLEWADWLSGQLDRHLNNLIFNVKVDKTKDGQTHIYSEVKGIDNDASFPEGRPKLGTFKANDGEYNIDDKDQWTHLIDKKGLRSARRPTFLPLSVKNKVMALKAEDIQTQLGPYLSANAIQSTIDRLEEMKAAIREHETEFFRLVDDTQSVEGLSDRDSIELAKKMETFAKNQYNECRKKYGNDNVSVFGGFYGSIFY